MYRRKTDRDIRCPLEYGMGVFGGKWKTRILCVLAAKGQVRYNALREEMANVTDPVLAAALRELAADGIVRRTQYPEIPPRVEYSLTPQGETLIPILQSICEWAGAYRVRAVEEQIPLCAHCRHRRRE